MIASTQCTVPISTLRALPFAHAWGSSIYARVVATNYLGSSQASAQGNGAIILTYPDDPINLANNLDITWGETLGLVWDETDANAGGTPVIDYTVMVKTTGDYQEHQIGVVGTSATMDGFILGTTYTFKVKSRNQFDFSTGYTNEVSILAAKSPEQPQPPTTSVDATTDLMSNVIINWTAPTDNGSPITGYKLYIRQNNLIYSEDLVNCNGLSPEIIAAT